MERMAKIMIVDDEPDTVRLVRRILENEGCKVIEACDGFECLRTVKHVKPDLILLDIMMPFMDGWSVLEKIKGEEEFRDLPVLVFTAKALDERDRGYIQSYRLPVVRKPFRKNDLVETIKQAMKMI